MLALLKMVVMVVVLKLLITVIIGQTLFFKFSGAPESMYIFNQLGAEPWGRITLGILELIAIVLLWVPRTMDYAIVLVVGMMLGALASHLFVLGIEVLGDGGKLFGLAIVTCLSAVGLLYYRRAIFLKLLTLNLVVKR